MSTLFTFPGQGVQRVGMLSSLPQTKLTANLLTQASEILNMNVMDLETEPLLKKNSNIQLGLTLCSYIQAQNLIEIGITPEYVLGLSIGAFASAMTAKVLDFSIGLELVYLRGKLMEEAYPSGYAMAVVTGLPTKLVTSLINQFANGSLFVANINTEQETTVSGDIESLKLFCKTALSEKATSAKLLKVNIPSHCQLLNDQAKLLERAMLDVVLYQPTYCYVSANQARVLHDKEQIRDDLAQNMAKQVHWWESTAMLAERGVSLAFEMPPGNVLTKLCSKTMPETICVDTQNERAQNLLELLQCYKR